MDGAKGVMVVVVIGLIALLGIVIFAPLADMVLGLAPAGDEHLDYPENETVIELDSNVDGDPATFEIAATEGFGAAIDGDGHVEGVDADSWFDGRWTVCAAGELNENANENATYSLFAVDNESFLLEYAGGEWAAHHYVGDDVASASVDSNASEAFDGVCARWQDGTETLTVATATESDSSDLGSELPDRQFAADWGGTVDEIRLVNESMALASMETYGSDPVDALGDYEHSARYMFNEGSGGETFVHYADEDAQMHNAGWSAGVAAPSLTEGVDYVVSFDPLSVEFPSDGYLADAPFVTVSWADGLGESVANTVEGISGSMQLIPIILLVILASVVIAVVARMRT